MVQKVYQDNCDVLENADKIIDSTVATNDKVVEKARTLHKEVKALKGKLTGLKTAQNSIAIKEREFVDKLS